MKKRIIKARSKKGSVLVELALLTPFLLLLVGGIFEIGRMYYIQNTLEYSAKEAARIGSSIKESADASFMSKGTISRREIENLIVNSVRVKGVIEEPGQFTIRYLNPAGNEIQGIQNDLPFDRENNPGAIDFIEVEIKYPGVGTNVNKPIPVIFNPGDIFMNSITLKAKSVFKIEGRFER